MSITSELTKLTNNVSDAYNVIERKGGIVPENKNTDNLPEAIDSLNEVSPKIYGVMRPINSSVTTWTRLNDAVSLVANPQIGDTPVQNDFDDIYPWNAFKTVNISNDGTINAYIGDDDFKFDGTNGQVMTIIPPFYWNRYQDGTNEYILISEKEIEGYHKSEEFMVARYSISGSSSGIYSRSGYAPLVSTTRANFRNYAKNLGSNWCLWDWHYFILQILYLVEYADNNIQNAISKGYTNANSATIVSGSCDFLGMKSGRPSGTDGKTSMIYRGIEDIFGNVYQFQDGINIKEKKAYINKNPNTYADDVFTGDYKAISYTNASVNGYISKVGYDTNYPEVAYPIEISGSETTGYADSYYQNTGNRIPFVGGSWNSGLHAGVWFWACHDDSSNANAGIGSRLLRY